MALSGFTSVPVVVLWILFFVVWGIMFLHKFRSLSLPPNQFIQLQNIFDEEDDFAIDDDINITSLPRKSHSIREILQQYLFPFTPYLVFIVFLLFLKNSVKIDT
jgi:hypothetical protein